MIKFFRSWCEELILASFIVSILEMLMPEGKNKKYLKVLTGIFIILVMLNPLLSLKNKVDFESEISNILEASNYEYDIQSGLDNSYKILNSISENLVVKEENLENWII